MMLLEAREVTHYFAGLCAVSDFNLALEEGELAAIIGPNGAGKTTVFNLITGVYRATRGSIRFGGRELVGLPTHQIARLGIGRTFQNIRLFQQLSVIDNVRIACFSQTAYGAWEALLHLGRYSSAEKRVLLQAEELLAEFGLAELRDELAANLPYGMQRRLEMARALAARPKLLLLDEPAAGMNPEEIGGLMQLIERVHREHRLTILLIEHQMRLVMGICRRIVVLDFGATIGCGSPEQIRSDAKVLEAYLGEEI